MADTGHGINTTLLNMLSIYSKGSLLNNYSIGEVGSIDELTSFPIGFTYLNKVYMRKDGLMQRTAEWCQIPTRSVEEAFNGLVGLIFELQEVIIGNETMTYVTLAENPPAVTEEELRSLFTDKAHVTV